MFQEFTIVLVLLFDNLVADAPKTKSELSKEGILNNKLNHTGYQAQPELSRREQQTEPTRTESPNELSEASDKLAEPYVDKAIPEFDTIRHPLSDPKKTPKTRQQQAEDALEQLVYKKVYVWGEILRGRKELFLGTDTRDYDSKRK